MKRWLLFAGLVGCASGDEPATLPTTFTSASASASATATASAGDSSSDSTTSDASASDPSDPSGDPSDPSDTSGMTSMTGMTSSGSGSGGSTVGGSSGDVESEQPEDGMYSACASPLDCIGLTTCLIANDSGGQPIDPFCTDGACDSPLADCQPTPGGTAVPICLMVEVGGVMDSVCALDCSQGQECPAGMNCRTLAGGSICS